MEGMRRVWRACIVGTLFFSFSLKAPGQEKILQVSEQELRAAASRKIDPEYPAVARQIRLTGEVDLDISVDPSGSVEKATVTRGNTLLAATSLQAIRKWRFTPFRANGQPVHAEGMIRFTFRI
jgi:protein TonB